MKIELDDEIVEKILHDLAPVGHWAELRKAVVIAKERAKPKLPFKFHGGRDVFKRQKGKWNFEEEVMDKINQLIDYLKAKGE